MSASRRTRWCEVSGASYDRVRDGESLDRAAAWLRDAEAVLIAAGAGMGVDSGLPDFRGTEGFWRAYPPYARLNVRFEQMADPVHFHRDPEFAWGFYGHRRALYRSTVPHEGFSRILQLIDRVGASGFVFTSNVDGQFQRAGFAEAEIVECHGAIDHEQCVARCGRGIWAADPRRTVQVDPERMRAVAPLPTCPACGTLARPNILMFGDMDWDDGRTAAQWNRFASWLERHAVERMVIIELGAGTAVPSVRAMSERLQRQGAGLIRVNPREPQVPKGAIGITAGAKATLAAIHARVTGGSPAASSP